MLLVMPVYFKAAYKGGFCKHPYISSYLAIMAETAF